MARLRAGAPADHVQQAARRGLAIDRGGRATQQGEAIQVPGFGLGVGVHAAWQRQAVEELGRFEAANAHPVVAGVAAVAGGHNAGHVFDGVIQVLHVAVLHLLAGGDGDRARCFDQRGIGLGAGGGARRQVALHRAPGTFSVALGNDAGLRQRHDPVRNRHQRVSPRAALLHLQAAAAQCLAQCARGVELALDRRRGFARGQCRAEGQREAGLAGDLVQGGGQWRGGQVVGAHVGRLLGGDQHGACQRGAEGNGHG